MGQTPDGKYAPIQLDEDGNLMSTVSTSDQFAKLQLQSDLVTGITYVASGLDGAGQPSVITYSSATLSTYTATESFVRARGASDSI